jgi:acetate---CoA ligase (ADP-forming)
MSGHGPDREHALEIIAAALASGRTALSEHESKQVLDSYGIPITAEALVSSHVELTAALSQFEFPVALKIDSPDIQHKTDAGLVILGCRSGTEAIAAFDQITRRAGERFPSATVNGVLVQEMVTGAIAECIVGMKKDPQFGPTILFGLGGIFVEVFEDVALRVAPLTPVDAGEMIHETKGVKLLTGARGRAPADLAAVEDVLLKLSRLALDLEPYLAEIDINPLMVSADAAGAATPRGEPGTGASVKAADALIILDQAAILDRAAPAARTPDADSMQ